MALAMYSVLKSRIIADWSIENMNVDIPSNGILLDVSASPPPPKKNNKENNP